jgi:hypothetical protein
LDNTEEIMENFCIFEEKKPSTKGDVDLGKNGAILNFIGKL